MSQLTTTEPGIHLLEQSTDLVRLQMDILENLIFFQGHFQNKPVLPGVVQVDWAILNAQKFFNINSFFGGLRHLKFTQIIYPKQSVILQLQHNSLANQTTFTYQSNLGKHAHGTIIWSQHV